MTNQRMSPLAWLGAALVVAIALMVIFGVLSFSTYGGYYGMMGSGSWGWAVVMMAVPAGILIVILLAALGGLREPVAYPGYAPANSLEVLEQRYARGEVSREDYLKIRDDLSHGPSHS
jgi:putative membrane protein